MMFDTREAVTMEFFALWGRICEGKKRLPSSALAMRYLFAPATFLMNRLGYTKKFTLLWLMSLAAIAVVVTSLYTSLEKDIHTSRQELEGLALIQPIFQAVQFMQQHRGLSCAFLGGRKDMGDWRLAKEKETAEAFNVLTGTLPPRLASSTDWRGMEADWVQLQKEGLKWTAEENFAAHTRLIRQMLLFQVFAADEYALTLDFEIGSYYMIDISVSKLPEALEYLGQIRAYGIGILSGKQATEQQKVKINTLAAQLDETLDSLKINIEKASRRNPTMRGPLMAAFENIAGSARQIVGIVQSDIIAGHFATTPEDFYTKASAAIDKGYAQMYESLLPTTEALIKARIARAENGLRTSIGIALLLILIVAYFSAGIYYAISRNIQSLALSARAFSGGDLRERVDLGTRDELKQVGDSFNEMADGFRTLLEERKQAEAALRASEERFRAYIEQAADALFVHDFSGQLLEVNRRACISLGYSREELLGMSVFDVETDFDLARGQAAWSQIYPGQPFALYGHHRRKDGTTFPVEVQFGCFDLQGGRCYMGLVRDITERERTEQALIESSKKLHSVIETALDAVVQMDVEGGIIGWNKQAEKTFGWSAEEAIGRTLNLTIIPLQYREAHARGLKNFLESGDESILNSRVEMKGLHRDGREFPIELSITAVRTADKYEFNGFIRDITARKESEDMIWRQANYDTLTGLPNRRMFHDRLTLETKKLHRSRFPLAVLFIDIDKFKEVNDTLGHDMGDTLLVEAAHRIGGCVRETDTVARLGGDEFTVVMNDIDDIHRVDVLCQNILHALDRPFHLGSEEVYLSASIGITLYPNDTTEVGDLLKNADQAMYAAKHAGGRRFSYFTPSMQQAALTRLRLANDLRGALAAGQFRVYFQPIVDLATGRIDKAEALIRWQHPVRGMVSPAEFIALAEETGLIVEIGDWVFRETAQQIKRWRTRYNPELQISVNESPVQFRGDNGPHTVWPAYLQELDLPGQSMVIEITEGVLLSAEPDVLKKLLQFHSAGIQISLDDFGTGYSSLSYLMKFDLDYLKIDQSFIQDLAPDSGGMALSEAIIVMAHKLGIKVIAEGVETEQQRNLLAAVGCDYGQGYLFSRPVPPEEFEKLLQI
ncbi:MAG: EAL domain-containing protein [Gammaproteobacteria bacterium]|nr:EAL domain-containing protein [Gammaproteobacteria bacterium]